MSSLIEQVYNVLWNSIEYKGEFRWEMHDVQRAIVDRCPVPLPKYHYEKIQNQRLQHYSESSISRIKPTPIESQSNERVHATQSCCVGQPGL